MACPNLIQHLALRDFKHLECCNIQWLVKIKNPSRGLKLAQWLHSWMLITLPAMARIAVECCNTVFGLLIIYSATCMAVLNGLLSTCTEACNIPHTFYFWNRCGCAHLTSWTNHHIRFPHDWDLLYLEAITGAVLSTIVWFLSIACWNAISTLSVSHPWAFQKLHNWYCIYCIDICCYSIIITPCNFLDCCTDSACLWLNPTIMHGDAIKKL